MGVTRVRYSEAFKQQAVQELEEAKRSVPFTHWLQS